MSQSAHLELSCCRMISAVFCRFQRLSSDVTFCHTEWHPMPILWANARYGYNILERRSSKLNPLSKLQPFFSPATVLSSQAK